MVDASELAWRMLGRRYGVHLAYTPMWHSGVFIRDEKYRQTALQTCPGDRPLIVQFCANDPETFRKAVDYTVRAISCDAIDLNIGCPQVIARRGHFGSYLQDEWDLLTRLVGVVRDNFDVPITCKLRVFEDVQKTVDYAKMLESAGAQLLAVHGRTRDQKGHLTGVASWDHIRAVKAAVSVPVFANGNVQYFADVARCLSETGVDGVMSAEGHLTNPALFAGKNPPVWEMCLEYLDLAEEYPCPALSYARGHMFKLMHHTLQMRANSDIRETVAKAQSLSAFREAVLELRERLLPFHTGEKEWTMPEELAVFKLRFPPWLCQPYVRPAPEEHLKKVGEAMERERSKKRDSADKDVAEGTTTLSKKMRKKMERNPNKTFTGAARENRKLCLGCPNYAGAKCDHDRCKKCCRHKCWTEELDCVGHRIQVKTKRERARIVEGANFIEPFKRREEEEELMEDAADNGKVAAATATTTT